MRRAWIVGLLAASVLTVRMGTVRFEYPEPSPPFPLDVTLPGSVDAPNAPGALLVIYRLLGPGDGDMGNRLRVTKNGTGVRLSF